MAARGSQNGWRGLESFLVILSNFCYIRFLIRALLLCDRGEKTGNTGKKRLMKILAITSLPAVDRPNVDHWNATRSSQQQQSFIYCWPDFDQTLGSTTTTTSSSSTKSTTTKTRTGCVTIENNLVLHFWGSLSICWTFLRVKKNIDKNSLINYYD